MGVELKYRLIVLTHGDGETLDGTLMSFEEMVAPDPTSVTVFRDDGSLGFCKNTQRAWADAASLKNVEYVFWLEHDFRFTRPLDLRPLATALEDNHWLTQMSLMRGAVSDEEKAAGSVHSMHTGRWVEWQTCGHLWLAHDICHTTNPSLMRRKFMEQNPWPDYPRNCEGIFSGDLRERGYSFATWGNGEVYVEHTGKLRTGHSY